LGIIDIAKPQRKIFAVTEKGKNDMRYVDADKLIAHLKDEMKECHLPFGSRSGGKCIAYGTILGLKSAISFAETLSTVDVVPKQAYLQFEETSGLKQAKAEVAREIFAEIEELAKIYTFPVVKNGVVEIEKEPFWCFEPNDLAELKKKYTEADSDG
jgi:hypothetical protein